MVPPWLGGGLADGDTKGPEEETGPGEENPPEINPFNQYAYMYNTYYSSSKAEKVTRDDLLTKNKEFKDRIQPLQEQISRLEKPDGSKEYPARTCRDLHQHYPEKKSGMYWIDPNLGCISDAIEVACTFESIDDEPVVKTCVEPTKGVSHDNWGARMKTTERQLFGEDHELGNLEYAADHSQLEFLGLLSATATQDVTVECTKYNAHENIAWIGTKSTEFSNKTDKLRHRPEVVGEDLCARMSDTSATTQLRFKTKKFVRLPIVDFKPEHSVYGKFGITPGAVCFE